MNEATRSNEKVKKRIDKNTSDAELVDIEAMATGAEQKPIFNGGQMAADPEKMTIIIPPEAAKKLALTIEMKDNGIEIAVYPDDKLINRSLIGGKQGVRKPAQSKTKTEKVEDAKSEQDEEKV